MRNLNEIKVMIRAVRLYINVHNFVYDHEGTKGTVCDLLTAGDLLNELKAREKQQLDKLAAEQESL